MNEIYFENVVKIGDLFLQHIFYEFELEPILFVCTDCDDNMYLCLCSEIRNGQKWLLTRCSINILKELLDEEIDVTSAFMRNSNITVIEMDLEGNEKSYYINTENVDELDLPKEGTYLRCDKEKARDYLWNKELDEMLEQSNDFLEIVDFDSYIYAA